MSVTRSFTTSMNNPEILSEALKKLGYKPEVLKEGKKIRGHAGEMSRQLCTVILKKEDTRRGADIGFSQAGAGNFEMVTDTYVNNDIRPDKFNAQIQVEYSKIQARRIAAKAGATFMGETNRNGKIILRFAKA